jgi:acyl carrier protein
MDEMTALLRIAGEALDDPDLTESAKASEARGYDSMSYIQLLVAVESEFGVRLAPEDVDPSQTMLDLLGLITRKRA